MAESFKEGKLDLILTDYKKHRAVGETTHNEETFTPIEKFTAEQLSGKEIVEKVEGTGTPQEEVIKKYVKSTVQKK
ncbi:MAG: hypothetical protein WCH65_03800 [bacterium]